MMRPAKRNQDSPQSSSMAGVPPALTPYHAKYYLEAIASGKRRSKVVPFAARAQSGMIRL